MVKIFSFFLFRFVEIRWYARNVTYKNEIVMGVCWTYFQSGGVRVNCNERRDVKQAAYTQQTVRGRYQSFIYYIHTTMSWNGIVSCTIANLFYFCYCFVVFGFLFSLYASLYLCNYVHLHMNLKGKIK